MDGEAFSTSFIITVYVVHGFGRQGVLVLQLGESIAKHEHTGAKHTTSKMLGEASEARHTNFFIMLFDDNWTTS